MKEDLGSQEALVSHVDGELFLADGVDAGVLLDPFGPVCVILAELLHQVGTDVTEALLHSRQTRSESGGRDDARAIVTDTFNTHLDGFGGLQRLLRRDAHLPLPQ